MGKEMDAKNSKMLGFWDLDVADDSDIAAWVYANSKSVVWLEFLRWRRWLGLPASLKVVDVGCGYGKMSLLFGLSGADVTLLDYNPKALESAVDAHRRIGLNPGAMNLDILDLPDKMRSSWDMVCSFGTLEHFSGKYREIAFRNCCSLLRPGGCAFFIVPNRYGVFYRLGFGTRRLLGLVRKDFFEKPFSRSELAKLASSAGIVALKIECIGTLRTDFSYWIGGNAKALMRKLFPMSRPLKAVPLALVDIDRIDLSGKCVSDRRSFLDRRLSAGWLLVGQRPK